MSYDATATRVHVYVSGAVIYAVNHNDNENELYTRHNGAFNATTGHTHTGAVGDGPLLPYVPPIGSVFAWDDYNGALTFNTTYYEYCDGTAVSSASSPLFGLLKRDLSNRYIVGYGTEGGADIGTAAYDIAALGNVSHQVNIAHAHSTDIAHGHADTLAISTNIAHGHSDTLGFTYEKDHGHSDTLAFSGPSHTHTGPSHSHGATGIYGDITLTGGNYIYARLSSASGSWNSTNRATVSGWTTDSSVVDYGIECNGNTSSSGTGATGASGTGSCGKSGGVTAYSGPWLNCPKSGSVTSLGVTNVAGTKTGSVTALGATSVASNSQLSATQSIQPRSMKLRYIIRVL